MTRKDYCAIATTIIAYNARLSGPRPSDDLGEMVADVLEKTFPNFDREKFEKEVKDGR